MCSLGCDRVHSWKIMSNLPSSAILAASSAQQAKGTTVSPLCLHWDPMLEKSMHIEVETLTVMQELSPSGSMSHLGHIRPQR